MLTREQSLALVLDVLRNDFEVAAEAAVPAARLGEDLDLDSIDAVDLAVRLQELTKKRIRPEQFKAVRTVADVVDAVEQMLRA